MTKPFLGSIFVGSVNPDRLRSWYRSAFGSEQAEQGPLDVGEVLLIFEKRTDIADASAEPGRAILTFHVRDAEETAAHLDSLGVRWLTELERRQAGYFASFLDPDGNCVQIAQFEY